ncbi:MAG: ABC transporter permease [Thermoleophilia bacterium]|nr:ABC transporter permease [Thermoleophilia bacterium]
MIRFVLSRGIRAALIFVVASVAVCYGLRVAPGSLADIVTNPLNRAFAVKDLEERLGLDEPVIVQYFVFVRNIMGGDFGVSFISNRSVTEIIATGGLNTLKLGGAAAILTYFISVPLGIMAAARRNSVIDQGSMLIAVLGMAIPNFFLAILLVRLFAVELRWLPAAGQGGIKHLILPAVVLAAEAIAINLRLVRASVLEQLSRDYIRTLRAKGASERRVVWIHAFRNALPPVITFGGVMLRTLLGYTLVVEVIFRYPGLGFELVDSVLKRDYAVAQALALVFIAGVVLFNFLADLGHHLAEPRIRERGAAG